ncbi:uncharacterized protein EMH_0051080 [Eimeria mitis]|uniref:Uncharacterized protein n=1 Tax=Eimeria mitis TaxID=44415 RepID=U6KDH5_9EIME|nr:uncharacterized protein EMH_0051080 [Eimeria mitis]CDJ35994.1 hypothetical protein, conserved [Eimeria mitis]
MLNSPDDMIRAVAEGQVLEVIKRGFVYTPDNESSGPEAFLAYLNADPESVARILNHSAHSLDSKINARHNKVLERITAAIKHSVVSRGKTFMIYNCPEDTVTLLRADIILQDEHMKTIKIADVAIVFEDYKENSLGSARIQKEKK